MQIRDINKPVNSTTLNETMAKKYGKKIDTDSFTLEQLQDARNRLRTKLSDIETNESFSGLSQNRTYSKNKLFLDILNAAISERADVEVDEGEIPKGLKDYQDRKGKGKKHTSKDKPAKGGKKPDFLDLDKDGNTKEPMDGAAKDAKKESKHVDEGKDIINNYFKTLIEGEEDKAEIVMAAKDMVDRLTGWMEDTAEMQSESMLELADAIRDEMGASQSEGFTNTVKPGLESLYAAMEATRVSLTQGVGMLTGEADPVDAMGDAPEGEMDDMADMEPTMDDELPAEADDFEAAAPAAGGDDEAGRAKRESLETSRRLGTILSSRS